MSKRKIFILFVFLVGAAILVFLFAYKKQLPTSPAAPLPTPKIPALLKGEYSLGLSIDETAFESLPRSSPLLERKGAQLGREEIVSIAKKIGFANEPLEANDVLSGKVFIFSGAKNSFVATPKTATLDYTLNERPAALNKQLSDESIKNVARDFLVNNGFVGPEEIAFGELVFLREAPGEGFYPTSRAAASFYQVNFNPQAAGRTVLRLNPQDPLISVRVLPDGEIFSAHVVRLGVLSESQTQYQLKNYKEFSSKINRSVLVSLDEGNVYLPDLSKGAVKAVSLKEVELSFLLESEESTVLQPVYLLSGTAVVVGFSGPVSAFLYLPAISSSN